MPGTIEDALMERAESARTAQTPTVVVVATIEEDLTHTQAQTVAGILRREVMNTDPVVQNVKADYTVNSFGAHTASAINWSDAQNIRSLMRMTLQDEGYTVKGVSIMAEIGTTSF